MPNRDDTQTPPTTPALATNGSAPAFRTSGPRGGPRPSGVKRAGRALGWAVCAGRRTAGFRCLVPRARARSVAGAPRGTIACRSRWGSTQRRIVRRRRLRPRTDFRAGGEQTMEVLCFCCCGLDVHKDTVVACLVRSVPAGVRTKETRTFGTTTGELGALRGRLVGAGCTHAALESTGVYWKPVFNVLTEPGAALAVWVVNAQHVRAIPGRKTDVQDAEWLADLLQHGLLRPSFIPSREQRARARPDPDAHAPDRRAVGGGQAA